MRLTHRVFVAGHLALVLACHSVADPPTPSHASDASVSAAATGGYGGSGANGAGGLAGAGGEGGHPCVDSLPVDSAPPEKLSETGLYGDIATKQIAVAVRAFTPRFELWSDGADKQRWIYLPECSGIDTSDMNDWSLPVGARLFKEFSVDGARIETRLVQRIGPGDHDFIFAAYLWNDEETEAERVPQGQANAKGTTHDVPDETACRRCHGSEPTAGGRPSRVLGFSAIQLSDESAGLNLAMLVSEQRLSHPPSPNIVVPGDATAQAALGYLHANCGHCHNDTASGVAQVDLNFWLDVDLSTVASTPTYLTTVGQPTTLFKDQHVTARIEPGKPESSAVSFRMGQRGNNAQMPPIATEKVDEAGLAAIESWIASLSL